MKPDNNPIPAHISADKAKRWLRLLDLLEMNGCSRADDIRTHIERIQDDEIIEQTEEARAKLEEARAKLEATIAKQNEG